MCIIEDCKTRPIYNKEGEKKPLYCSKHKLDGMVDVISKTCIYEGCKVRPTYNKEGEKKPLYCNKHKLDSMVNVVSKTCKSEWCATLPSNKQYKGYCLFCYVNLFPGQPVSRNYKTKEFAVVEYVKHNFPNLTWISDKSIENGCSRRRPDLLLDLGYQVIIVEIDENQHNNYDCGCDNKRTMELSKDLNHRPLIFIRFNPDQYYNKGKSVPSCWGTNCNGICVVKKTKTKEWQKRLNTLKEQIDYWVIPEHKTNKTVEIIQLFYDIH